jgi:hypothetical protein
MSSTTFRLDEKRREKLKEASYQLSISRKEVVKMTDIIKDLIDLKLDQYLKEEEEKKES